MDIPTVVTVISAVLAVATFFVGRKTASHDAGKEAGEVRADVRYIRETMERIERGLGEDINRLEGRVDEISRQAGEAKAEAIKANESAKSAHHRIDELRN